ncbi:acetyl-CoA C-acetyltransferase [Enterobacter asburiae]|nr:acetyl-CoA C-acetyltransferase [Enterobacter asburiae]
MADSDVVVLDACRTAIGALCGALADTPASVMGGELIKAMLERHDIPASEIDEVIIGQALTAGCGQNPARQSALHAGVPERIPAFTVNKVCGSGLKAIQLACLAIRNGDADLIIAGGQENMSQAPLLLLNHRDMHKMGDRALKDSMLFDGLTDAFYAFHMGETAERISRAFDISREEQDLFALHSQMKAHRSIEAGLFCDEIIPLSIKKKGKDLLFSHDEFPRSETTIEKLASLQPAFQKNGTVTAGNSSGVNDGAAMIILASAGKARELGVTPLCTLKHIAGAGVSPALMGTGPVPASRKALEMTGWSVNELDVIESNEAFSAQAIYVNKEMGWDCEKVNVNGGAIALGHPIGASGARIFVSLLYEMRRRKACKGLATLCVGGGMGIAATVQMDN